MAPAAAHSRAGPQSRGPVIDLLPRRRAAVAAGERSDAHGARTRDEVEAPVGCRSWPMRNLECLGDVTTLAFMFWEGREQALAAVCRRVTPDGGRGGHRGQGARGPEWHAQRRAAWGWWGTGLEPTR